MKHWGSGLTLMALLLALSGCGTTQPGAAPAIHIDHMVIPAAQAAGSPVAAYAGFDNRGADDRLLGIDCDCAKSVDLHRVVRDGDKVSMSSSFPLALPANERVEVKPPGIPLHFMLLDTYRSFAVGDRVPMRLRFERAGTVEVVFTVAPDSATGWNNWTAP